MAFSSFTRKKNSSPITHRNTEAKIVNNVTANRTQQDIKGQYVMGREGGRAGQIQRMALDPVGSSEGKTHSGQPHTGEGRGFLLLHGLLLKAVTLKGSVNLGQRPFSSWGHSPLFLKEITKHRAAAKAAGSNGNETMGHF